MDIFTTLTNIKKMGLVNAIILAYLRSHVNYTSNYMGQYLYENNPKLLHEFYSRATEEDIAQFQELQNGGDWYIIPHKLIKEDLEISTERQVKHFKELVKRKYIETKRKGIPGRRWIRLCDY